jgi:REP element-mobilizing transposase RayT
MPRSRYRIFEDDVNVPYFLTCTVVGWLPIFTRPESVDIVLNSWRFLQKKNRLTLYGYVIMENHLHLIASSPDLRKEIGDFKSFTAKEIIKLLKLRRVRLLLDQLEQYKGRHKTGQLYQLWQEGSHPKRIGSDEMMTQKLDYMHLNPVARGYVEETVHWRYSSARNYAGLPGLIDVKTCWWE